MYVKNCGNKTITNTCNLSLHEPNQLTREVYAKLMKHTISKDSSLRKELIVAFRASNKQVASTIKGSTIASVVSHIAVCKVLGKVRGNCVLVSF